MFSENYTKEEIYKLYEDHPVVKDIITKKTRCWDEMTKRGLNPVKEFFNSK